MKEKSLHKNLKILLTILSILFINISTKFTIDPISLTLKDKFNRSTIFHGVNVVVKAAPYLPTNNSFDPLNSLNLDDIKIMKKLGFNFVRLGVIWESVEKSPKKYDFEHLKKVKDLVNLLGKHGIYTLIDIHQDLFSRLFCGEGVPTFYAEKLPYEKTCDKNLISKFLGFLGVCISTSNLNWKYEENNQPNLESCRKDFLKTHQAVEITSSYTAFWENYDGIQDNFIDYLAVLMEFFNGNDYVVGLNPWNEPMQSDMFSDLWNLISTHANESILTPFYNKIYNRLKEVNPELIYMLEPFPFPDTIPLFGGMFFDSFKNPPLGKNNLDKHLLNFHSYCCLANLEICNTPEREVTLENALTTCKVFHEKRLKKSALNARELGIPALVSEFGACSDSQACYWDLKNFLDAAEDNLLSWAYWMYKPFNDHTTVAERDMEGIFHPNGKIQEIKEKALSRTYVLSYPGIAISSKFLENGEFFSEFLFDGEIKSPLVLYMNKEYFYKDKKYEILIEDENGNFVENEINVSKENNLFNSENYLDIKIFKEFSKGEKGKLKLRIVIDKKNTEQKISEDEL